MEYLKLDPDIDSNPEIMRAGWWGARFFELLLKVSAKKDLKGRIPPDYQDTTWLARMWNLQPADLEDVEVGAWISRGLKGAVGAQLVTIDGEDWVLRGWDKFYKPAKTGAQRQAAYEKRQRIPVANTLTTPDDAPSASVSDDATDETDATSHHSTPPTSLHTTSPTNVRAGVPAIPEKPEKPDGSWDGMDFWAWAQAKRKEAGLQPERRPNERTVSTWWSHTHMQGVQVKALRLAFVAFGNDPFWTDRMRKPPVPFGGFVSQWERFVEPEAVHAA